jgi:DNA-binding NarL/FixJ family response regulator
VKQPNVRILIVDDYEPWRRYVTSTLHNHPELLIVGEVADRVAAVEKAQELLPDLILLDIGLPKQNGIEAARRIRQVAPNSKILFISEHRSSELAKAALGTGALGYLVKSDAASQLLRAVETVSQGKQFVSASLSRYQPTQLLDEQPAGHPPEKKIVELPARNVEIARHHEVAFYSDDRWLLDRITKFIGTALTGGNAAVVAAIESHRESLIPSLQSYGVDIGAAIEQGRYLALDAADTLSLFMVNGIPDPVRFMEAFGNAIQAAAKTSKGEHPRVAVYGECVHLLCEQGNVEAAVQMEKLGNQLANLYDVNILCLYSLACIPGGKHSHTFQRICAEHSAVYCH